jgi:transposase-like protein
MELAQLMERDGGLVAPKRRDSERSELARSEGATSPPAAAATTPTVRKRPDPEVPAKAARRRYSAAYKRRILQEADRSGSGGIAVLLRREGLYSSHLTTWRKQREAGEIAALQPRKRGRKAIPSNPLAGENARLQRENDRLAKRLQQAETIIEVQKKLCTILGLPVHSESGERNE